MGIKVSWQNDNTGETETRIYRSQSPIDPVNLPAPVGTVGPGITEFEDVNVPEKEVWFYRFGVMLNGEEILSQNESVYTSAYRGPGPQELIAGNYHEFGYFGWMSVEELFNSYSDYRNQLLNGNSYIAGYDFHKVFHDGKVKYIPMPHAISYGYSWSQLYEVGLVFGEPGYHEEKISPEIYAQITPTDQGKTLICKDGDVLKPRLFKGWGGETPWAGEIGPDYWDQWNNSEFRQIYMPLCGYRGNGYDKEKVRELPAPYYPHAFQETNGYNFLDHHSQNLDSPGGQYSYTAAVSSYNTVMVFELVHPE